MLLREIVCPQSVLPEDCHPFGNIIRACKGIPGNPVVLKCWNDIDVRTAARLGPRYPCGEYATQALRTRIGPDAVTCTIEGRDRYLRALGICYAADGTDLNGWLVSQGHALAYRRYSTTYVPQEDQAKAAQAGLWAGAFITPWDWRRGVRLD